MPSKTENGVATATPTLGEEINIATRPLHTNLNKLIIHRLRLALPPHAGDAKNYVTGLLHIAPIYQAFEREWDAILENSPTAAKSEDRVRSLLADLHIDGLARANALQEDIAALLGWNDALVRTRMESVSQAPVLVEFQEHIHKAIQARPHVLVAYAWVLYMALFSGGRFIRASLERVDRGTGFWSHPASSNDTSEPEFKIPGAFDAFPVEEDLRKHYSQPPPLNFFRFDTPEDGEDLKNIFKETLAMETSIPERADIVKEAQAIFEHMIRIVGELDKICGTEYEEQVAAATAK